MATQEQMHGVEVTMRRFEHDIPGFALWLLSSIAQDHFTIPYTPPDRDGALKVLADAYLYLPGGLQFVFQQGIYAALTKIDQAAESTEWSETRSALIDLSVAVISL